MKHLPMLAAATFATSLVATQADALVTHAAVPAPTLFSAAGVSSFQTLGSTMGGMEVTATFAGGLTEKLTWVNGAGSFGGATGTFWSISMNGDSFNVPFIVTNTSGAAQQGAALTNLFFDATKGDTVFDRSFGGIEGTPGSANGQDLFDSSGLGSGGTIAVTYQRAVAVGMNPPVGDLFGFMNVDLTGVVGGGLGIGSTWQFIQDTDNLQVAGDIGDRPPGVIPVPAALPLLATGLAGFAFLRRRRRA